MHRKVTFVSMYTSKVYCYYHQYFCVCSFVVNCIQLYSGIKLALLETSITFQNHIRISSYCFGE